MSGRSLRVVGGCCACALLIGMAGGCDDPDAAPSVSTIAQTSTTYVTIPARTTTSTAAPRPQDDDASGEQGDEGESIAADDPTQERVHEVRSGDYLLGIARTYDVPINYIPEYNGWDDGLGHSLVPGGEVRIPPSDWTPESEATDGSTAGSDGSEPGAPVECADGGPAETYRIRANDTPARVADRFGVTVEELNAANEETRFYQGFVVGITITIPC